MLSGIKKQALARKPHILAVETAVVDLQYAKDTGHDQHKREFFAQLKELVHEGGGTAGFDENPRPGDMRLIPAEDFDAALIAFGKRKNIIDASSSALSSRAQAQIVCKQIFGSPAAVAGGSLANTLYGVIHAGIDGVRLVEGHFATAVGDDSSGLIFADSLHGNIHCNRGGRQMECHVYPIDHDRILIATPSKHDPAEAHINSSLFNMCALDSRDRIMLGGFLFFTPGFHEIFDTVIDHLKTIPADKRPTIVVTAAAQAVAANSHFRNKIKTITSLADTVIHANTGEFRRLMDRDIDWREPFKKDFAGLKEQDLEAAKDAHAPYQAAKAIATGQVLDEAVRLCGSLQHNLRFVVTNGSRETYVIDRNGFNAYKPVKLDKSRIINTVGAGDNFAAGFQLGDLYGLPQDICVSLGHDFAQAVIQQPSARLDQKEKSSVVQNGRRFELNGSLSFIKGETLQKLTVQTKPSSGPQP